MNLKFRNGDLVLVQKQDELENNEIGVTLVNGFDATVKNSDTKWSCSIRTPIYYSRTPITDIQPERYSY